MSRDSKFGIGIMAGVAAIIVTALAIQARPDGNEPNERIGDHLHCQTLEMTYGEFSSEANRCWAEFDR